MKKSEEIKKEIELLATRFNQLVQEEQKIMQSKNNMMLELQKLKGKYEAYLEVESQTQEVEQDGKKQK